MILGELMHQPAKFIGMAVLTGALALSGCAVAPTSEELAATRDECSQFRAPFTEISTERDQRIARYAQVGATVGAGLGENIARNRNEDPLRGAITGLVAGAVLGAAGGYLADLENRSSSTAGLQRAVNGDASRDLREADRLVRAMSSLNNCRLQQIAAVERNVRAGGDRDQARAQIRFIRQKVAIDNRVINAVVGDLTQTRNLYVNALNQSGANTENFVSSIQQYQPRVTTPQRTALRVDRSARPRTSNAVANLGYAERELSAGAAAHVQSVDAAIDELDDILI